MSSLFMDDDVDDRAVSRMPFPTLDQVAGSVAIQRLFWMRQLPYPRTNGERRVLAAIRARGWRAEAV